ncbi:MAG TPA: Holliday junction branch migration protein RuvA, partial [Patescibacteria group bacterium]|nr:Holliday junction branch migration protein RuvA [Patescibacteria group bacterium]
MIGQLRGVILEKQPPQLLLEVNGVGYEVDAPMSTFYRLPDVGQMVLLHTHFVVREDAHHLYGFYSREERSLFRTLLKVNGVGPKLALTILSGIDTKEFVQAILNNDTANLVRLPGVGKKTAERLIVEMRDKFNGWQETLPNPIDNHDLKKPMTNQAIQDAISALIALGYKPQEASRAISKIEEKNLNSEEMI